MSYPFENERMLRENPCIETALARQKELDKYGQMAVIRRESDGAELVDGEFINPLFGKDLAKFRQMVLHVAQREGKIKSSKLGDIGTGHSVQKYTGGIV